ncbi:MAG: hypothetical protein M1831_000480 [Alyxoria varia]|nr:MAG: hypothetical protein M1831_000480 [Alyxoria varia]
MQVTGRPRGSTLTEPSAADESRQPSPNESPLPTEPPGFFPSVYPDKGDKDQPVQAARTASDESADGNLSNSGNKDLSESQSSNSYDQSTSSARQTSSHASEDSIITKAERVNAKYRAMEDDEVKTPEEMREERRGSRAYFAKGKTAVHDEEKQERIAAHDAGEEQEKIQAGDDAEEQQQKKPQLKRKRASNPLHTTSNANSETPPENRGKYNVLHGQPGRVAGPPGIEFPNPSTTRRGRGRQVSQSHSSARRASSRREPFQRYSVFPPTAAKSDNNAARSRSTHTDDNNPALTHKHRHADLRAAAAEQSSHPPTKRRRLDRSASPSPSSSRAAHAYPVEPTASIQHNSAAEEDSQGNTKQQGKRINGENSGPIRLGVKVSGDNGGVKKEREEKKKPKIRLLPKIKFSGRRNRSTARTSMRRRVAAVARRGSARISRTRKGFRRCVARAKGLKCS